LGARPNAQVVQTQFPAQKKTNGCLIALAVFVGLLFLLAIIGSVGKKSGGTGASPATYGIKTSPEANAGREAWIANAITLGVFLKIGDSQPVAYVGPAWSGMTFEQKGKAAGVIAAHFYLKNSDNTLLLLYDGYTGKIIGVYSFQMGLQLD